MNNIFHIIESPLIQILVLGRAFQASFPTPSHVLILMNLIILLLTQLNPMRLMPGPKGPYMVLERPLVPKIRPTYAEPKLATVLLVGAPVPAHRERLGAPAARKWLGPVLAPVVGLQRVEVLERLRQRMVDVVPAPLGATVARHSQHARWRLRAF